MDSSSEIDVRAGEAREILRKLADAIRGGAANRFQASVKPLFDEFWDLAKHVADHED